MMNKIKRLVALAMCLVLPMAVMVGCGSKESSGDGTVTITVGGWPNDTNPKELERMNGLKAEFEEKYPNIKIQPDSTSYNAQGFMAAAVSGTLPNYFQTAFTEVGKAIDSGYVADLTEYMDKYGYIEALNPSLTSVISKDDKYYGVPTNVYTIGLMCNRKLFEEAGLVNEDGTIQIPQTYEDLALTAQTIREKTGKAGFALPTTSNHGGWLFMEIAWANGVEFMEQDENGKWKATFNTPEMVEALQYVKDLKWKYNALQDNGLADYKEVRKLYGTNQAAMYLGMPPENMMVRTYEFDKNNMAVGRVPEGKEGRYTQLGGNIVMVSANSTPEQIDAIFKWLEFNGHAPKITDEELAKLEEETKTSVELGNVIIERAVFSRWIDKTYLEKHNEVLAKYANVDSKNFKEYLDGEDVALKAEEPVSTQQLYEIIDSGIQRVISDKNADVKDTVAEMAENFQKNYLDNQE